MPPVSSSFTVVTRAQKALIGFPVENNVWCIGFSRAWWLRKAIEALRAETVVKLKRKEQNSTPSCIARKVCHIVPSERILTVFRYDRAVTKLVYNPTSLPSHAGFKQKETWFRITVLPEQLLYISNICFETSYLLPCLKMLLLWDMYPAVTFIALFKETCSLRANPHPRRAAAAQFHSFKRPCTQ